MNFSLCSVWPGAAVDEVEVRGEAEALALQVAVAAHQARAAVAWVAHHALLGLEAGAVLLLEAHAPGDDQRVLELLADLPPELRVLEDAVRLQLVLVALLPWCTCRPRPASRATFSRASCSGGRSGSSTCSLGVGAELVLQQARGLGRARSTSASHELGDEARHQHAAEGRDVDLGLQRRLDRHLHEGGAAEARTARRTRGRGPREPAPRASSWPCDFACHRLPGTDRSSAGCRGRPA